ncbi:MAG: 3-dehydroquinate synthase [Fimbriimonadaceae bacterium]|nr:3-dehydroquinate synthase [Alphaproteobacteria bacterium]
MDEIEAERSPVKSHGDSVTVEVGLGDRSYDIVIAGGLLSSTGMQLKSRFDVSNVAVITDENVGPLYAGPLEASLEQAFGGQKKIFRVTVPAGEPSKSFAGLERVCGELLDSGIERGDLIIALGGGVIGDLAGFAAGVLRRGVRFVQNPTSLLAQVDSSVGGKTGINTRHGKNLIGMFHQPSLVVADVGLLDTLPEREMRAGYAEVVKYGLIADAPFFTWLEKNGAILLAGDKSMQIRAIETSCRAKAALVAADEREAGARALLNLGHTFGHALEAAAGYDGRLIHGEGVAIGMVLAARLSEELGLCPSPDAARIEAHLESIGLMTKIGNIAGDMPDADGLIGLMAHDKKVRDGKLTFILLKSIGAAFTTQDISPNQLRDFLTKMTNTS